MKTEYHDKGNNVSEVIYLKTNDSHCLTKNISHRESVYAAIKDQTFSFIYEDEFLSSLGWSLMWQTNMIYFQGFVLLELRFIIIIVF